MSQVVGFCSDLPNAKIREWNTENISGNTSVKKQYCNVTVKRGRIKKKKVEVSPITNQNASSIKNDNKLGTGNFKRIKIVSVKK